MGLCGAPCGPTPSTHRGPIGLLSIPTQLPTIAHRMLPLSTHTRQTKIASPGTARDLLSKSCRRPLVEAPTPFDRDCGADSPPSASRTPPRKCRSDVESAANTRSLGVSDHGGSGGRPELCLFRLGEEQAQAVRLRAPSHVSRTLRSRGRSRKPLALFVSSKKWFSRLDTAENMFYYPIKENYHEKTYCA